MSGSRMVLLATGVVLCLLDSAMIPLPAQGAAPPARWVAPENNSLPPGAIARLGSLHLRHEREVRSIAFSPDGKKVAATQQDGSKIRVWETTSGRLVHEFDAR